MMPAVMSRTTDLMIRCVMLLSGVLAGVVSSAGAQSDDAHDLLRLRTAKVGSALPPSWVVRPVRGQRAPTSMVADSAGERYLRLSGHHAAGWFVHRLAQPVAASAATRLALWWRTVEAPNGADLRSPRTDDAALRLFVVFASRGIFERTPRTLFYSSGRVEPPSYERASFQSTALHVIRLADTTDGTWLSAIVSPFADYDRVWGGPPRPIVAVGFMQDTDQTRSRAIADVRSLAWRIPDATP